MSDIQPHMIKGIILKTADWEDEGEEGKARTYAFASSLRTLAERYMTHLDWEVPDVIVISGESVLTMKMYFAKKPEE